MGGKDKWIVKDNMGGKVKRQAKEYMGGKVNLLLKDYMGGKVKWLAKDFMGGKENLASNLHSDSASDSLACYFLYVGPGLVEKHKISVFSSWFGYGW